MAAKGVFTAAGAYGKQVRGGHFSSGHDHQIACVVGGSGSTAVVGINSNSILLQLQPFARKSGTFFVMWGNASMTDYTTNVSGVGTVAGKIVHSGKNYTNYVFLVSWDQPDA
jgi:hypothetical protein